MLVAADRPSGADREGHGSSRTADIAFTVAIGGDLSLARGIARRAAGEGWARVLSPLEDALSGAQARIVNLESATGPCLSDGTVQRPRLCSDAGALVWLPRAGVTAVTVANNHALDAGEPGLARTVEGLRKADVIGAEAVRSGKPVAEALGPIAVVAANLSRSAWPPGRSVPIPKPDEIAAAVRAAHGTDAPRPVLVILHGGREMDPAPSGFERSYAQSAVEAGAAAVVFHGSHVAHVLESIAGVPVHFGLGNLLFDQRDPKASRGRVLVLRFRPGVPAEVIENRWVESTIGRRCAVPAY
jgi:poly-gamma-glutamate synthesis protein (capsule biosynthesis protein)